MVQASWLLPRQGCTTGNTLCTVPLFDEDGEPIGQVDECVNLQTNRSHCGGCNVGCAPYYPNSVCTDGQCYCGDRPACPYPPDDDGPDFFCADFERSWENCGACGNQVSVAELDLFAQLLTTVCADRVVPKRSLHCLSVWAACV